MQNRSTVDSASPMRRRQDFGMFAHTGRIALLGMDAPHQGAQLAHLVDTIDQRLGAIFPTSQLSQGWTLGLKTLSPAASSRLKKNFP